MPRPLAFFAALLLAAAPAAAQGPDLGPVSVYDLAHGLRDAGHADLAVEYLESLAAKLPKEQLPELAVERAKARLDLANVEANEAKRDDLIATAKAEFENFLNAHAKHPRAPEARISLARVTTLLGKAQLGRAGKAEGENADDTTRLRKAQAAQARPLFEASAKQYAAAAKALEDQAAGATGPQKKDLTAGLYQALLDEGINQYLLGETYYKATDKKEVTDRSNAFKTARDKFAKLADRDPRHPLGWVARAWEGECYRPMQEIGKAEKVNDDIAKAQKLDATGPPAAGYRMSRFFLIRDKWVEAGATRTAAAFQGVRKLTDEWLRDYKSPKPTPEHFSVFYYTAFTYFDEAALLVKVDEKTKAVTVPEAARVLLLKAEREFRTLTQSDNDYKGRAAKERFTVMRLLVGEGTKSPAQIATFDECHMTMLVALDKLTTLLRAEPPADDKAAAEAKKQKDALFARVIALLTRERELPVPKESVKQAADSQITMVFVYRQAGRTLEAAVMAEALARSARSPASIAKAGENAVYAYLEAAAKLDPEDEASRAVDHAKALAVAAYLEKAAPDEPATEEIRLLQAKLLVQGKRYVEAFDALAKVSLGARSVVDARLLQGGIAYELLRYKSPNEAPADRKDAIRAKAIGDLERVPPPAKPADAMKYAKLRMQLAQLHLTGPASGYPAAEKVVADAMKMIPTMSGLKDEERAALVMQAEMVYIDAVYGQAMPLFAEKKYKECADKFASALVRVAAGPAVGMKTPAGAAQPDDLRNNAARLDTHRLDRLVMPALSAYARLGDIDSCGGLLDIAERLGGDVAKGVAAAAQVVEQAKAQVDAYRAEGKTKEADDLMAKITAMVNKLVEKPAVSPGMKYSLARACKDLGQYPKALELLAQVEGQKPKVLDPKPPVRPTSDDPELQDKFRKDNEEHTETMKVVGLYRAAVLEKARVYRLARMFKEGDALYDEVLGKVDAADKTKSRRTGWGFAFMDFRKEYFAYCEAKAAAQPDEKAALALWADAIANWDGLAGEYSNVIRNPKAAPEVRARMKDLYYDIFFESTRCAVAANLAINGKKPDKLGPFFEKRGKAIADFEQKNPDVPNAVRARYRGLLAEQKGLEAAYKAAGGGGFADRPDTPKPDAPAAGK